MSFKDILVHVDATAASRVRLRLALSLARRFDAQLVGLHVIPQPDVPPYFKPSMVARIAEIYAEHAREAAELAEALFLEETKAFKANTAWERVDGDLAEMIAERARFTDLLLLGQFNAENPAGISHFLLPEKVVFGAATPLIVVPNNGSWTDVGRHALITWDGSREAACAIRDGMPLLQTAAKVSLISIDPLRQGHMHEGTHTSALVAHLLRHGVRIEATETCNEDNNVATSLLTHAKSIGADLLMMGAYGHSRVLEFVLGGTTAQILERTQIPVLMSR